MKSSLKVLVAAGTVALSGLVQAAAVTTDRATFDAAAAPGTITFSERTLGTPNPSFLATEFGSGNNGFPSTVNLGAYFDGLPLSAGCPPAVLCFSAGLSTGRSLALVTGNPANADDPLNVRVKNDVGLDGVTPVNQTNPGLGSQNDFEGTVAMLFSQDVLGVAFDIGYVVGSPFAAATWVSAFNAAGQNLGDFEVPGQTAETGYDFFGLMSSQADIRGLMIWQGGGSAFDGFGIDNVRFAAIASSSSSSGNGSTSSSGNGSTSSSGNGSTSSSGNGSTSSSGNGSTSSSGNGSTSSSGNGSTSSSSSNGGGTAPEPGSLALVGLALIGVAIARRRKA